MTDGCRAWIQVVGLHVVISRWTKYKVVEANFGAAQGFKCQVAIWKHTISPVTSAPLEKKKGQKAEVHIYMSGSGPPGLCVCWWGMCSEIAYRQIDKAESNSPY